MQVVRLLKGMICSGKTQYAKELIQSDKSFRRVCRDDLREMLDGYSMSNETLVTALTNETIKGLIQGGYNVVIDEMHLNKKYLEQQMVFIRQCLGNKNYLMEVIACPVSYADAKERLIQRNKVYETSNPRRVIPEDVFDDVWDRYKDELESMLKPKEEMKQQPDKRHLPKAIICDIDGTLAKKGDRDIFDESKIYLDSVIEPVKHILTAVNNDVTSIKTKPAIIVVSGRKDSCYKQTEKWLKDNGVCFDTLYMRKDGDNRCDTIVKKEIYDNHIKDYHDVLYVIDDRHKVLQMWKDEGLFTINVNQDPFALKTF